MADHDEYPTIIIERDGGFGTLLMGALIGAGAALLLAPRSGRETRDELRAGMNRLRDRAEAGVREFQDNLNDSLGEVRTEVQGRVDAARNAFESSRQHARDTRHRVETGVRAGYEAARRPAAAHDGADASGDDEL
jgi:gas vesicle protein